MKDRADQAFEPGQGQQRLSDEPTSLHALSRAAPLRVSFGQERLWFLQNLDPGLPAYHLGALLWLDGLLDTAALEEAWAWICRRHEVFRTQFRSIRGQPFQVIQPSLDLALPVLDLTHLELPSHPQAVRAAAEAEARKPFDLEQAPLLRLLLIRYGENQHAFVVVLHHIVSDGASIRVLAREWATAYRILRAGESLEPPDLSLDYADYAEWQRQMAESGSLREHLGFWKQYLATALQPLQLPADRPRPAISTGRGGRQPLTIPGDLASALKSYAADSGTTLFTVLLAGYMALLQRYTAQNRVAVSIPVVGRDRKEFAGLVGFFVNAMIISSDGTGRPTFQEFLQRVHEDLHSAKSHAAVPYSLVVEALRPTRELAVQPLAQVAFSIQKPAMARVEFPGLKVAFEELATGTAKFDLALQLEDRGEELVGWLEYSEDLFDAHRIERMAGHFLVLLETAMQTPQARLSHLPILTRQESAELDEWSLAASTMGESVPIEVQIREQARKRPGAPAVITADTSLSYQDLDTASSRLAFKLREQGLEPGSHLVIWTSRSPGWIVAMLAALKAGCPFVPLDSAQPRERLAYILKETQARAVLTEKALREGLPPFHGQVLCLDQEEPLAATAGNNLSEPHQAHPAYVIYTSGSTGLPKGVVVSRGGLQNLVEWHLQAYPMQPGDRVSQMASPGFDAAQWEVWPALAAGASLHLVDEDTRLTPAALRDWLVAQRIHQSFVPTAMAEELLSLPWPEASDFRVMLVGGDKLNRRPTAGLGFQVVNHYGPTECSVVATAQPVGPQRESDLEAPPIGRPILGTSIHLLDINLQPVPVGIPGEICIGGRGLAWGYLGSPALTAEKFIPDHSAQVPGSRLYRTGDLAFRNPDGTLQFLGRLDGQVKVRGFRIELGEIEAVLRQHPRVRDAVVLCQGESGPEKRLVGFVLTEPEVAGSLAEFLAGRLPGYMVPSLFMPMDQFPMTASGKVARSALPQAAAPHHTSGRQGNVTELAIGKVWGEVLHLAQVGLEDNFFELGGNSLKAAELAARLREDLGLEASIRSVFTWPTVGAIAAHLPFGSGATGRIPAAPAQDSYELSHAQRRLWVLDQFKEHSPAYNIPAALLLSGTLDETAFQRAWDILIQRHECFQTGFQAIQGVPHQIIHRIEEFRFEVLDLRRDPDRTAKAHAMALQEAEKPFDLTCPPLARGTLIRLQDRETLFLWTMHHIIGDAWSMGVLLDELKSLYGTLSQNQEPSLPPLPVHYKDFALWQNSLIRTGALAQQKEFWLKKLRGRTWELELPLDKARPPIQSFNGNRVDFFLDQEKTSRLRGVAEGSQATLFTVVLSAWAILLHRYTGQRELGIGTPVAGRDHPDLFGLIGFLANTLVLPVRLDPDQSFREWLTDTQQTVLEAFDHRAYPFDLLVEDLDLGRDLSRSPLFNVMLAFNNTGLNLEGARMGGMEIRPFSSVQFNMSKFDLILFIDEGKDGLNGRLEYSTDLFKPETMARWIANLETLLEDICRHPDRPVKDLELIHSAERQLLLTGFNLTGIPFADLGVQALFEGQVCRSSGEIAAIWNDRAVTYDELNRAANRLANYLLGHYGVGCGIRIGLLLDRSIDMLASVLGVLKSGAAYVAIDPTYPRERVLEMIQDAQPPLLLTDHARPDLLETYQGEVLDLEQARSSIDVCSPGNPPCRNQPEDPLYILYTSGSTGVPNGAMLSHGQLANLVNWHREQSGIDGSLSCLQFTSLNFCVSFQEIFTTLCAGGRLFLIGEMERRDIDYLLDFLGRHQIANLYLPFSYLNFLFNETRRWERSTTLALKNLITAGEQLKISAGLKDFLRAHPEVALHNHYGSSEVHVVTAYTLPRESGEETIPPVGRPIANTRIFIVDESGFPAPLGAVGDICVACAGPYLGYLGKLDLTLAKQARFPWLENTPVYWSGDAGRWTADGNLLFLGRKDNQVKIRGFRVDLGDVENTLLQLEGVQACVVTSRPDRRGQTGLVAYICLDETLSPADVRQALKEKLPNYMIPTLVPLARLPLMPNGKVDREALPDPEELGFSLHNAYVAPRTDLETGLVRIWEEVLEQENIGVQDDFFEIGGHSLKATQVVSRIHDQFGVPIGLKDLFQEPTIERLAVRITAHGQANVLDELENTLQQVESLPPERVQELLATLGKSPTPENQI